MHLVRRKAQGLIGGALGVGDHSGSAVRHVEVGRPDPCRREVVHSVGISCERPNVSSELRGEMGEVGERTWVLGQVLLTTVKLGHVGCVGCAGHVGYVVWISGVWNDDVLGRICRCSYTHVQFNFGVFRTDRTSWLAMRTTLRTQGIRVVYVLTKMVSTLPLSSAYMCTWLQNNVRSLLVVNVSIDRAD